MNLKKLVAEAAVELVEPGMTVGLGTGTTAYWVIVTLGMKAEAGLDIRCLATSQESETLAKKLNLPMTTFSEISRLDLTIDGADEVDPRLNLIKGGGGALLREKIVASASNRLVIVVDETKLVEKLGIFPLPVEVIPFGIEVTHKKIAGLGCTPILRLDKNKLPFKTDSGHFILDCHFGEIENPELIEQKLNMIPGVVENGLFIKMADQVLVGCDSGDVKRLNRRNY